MDNTTKTPPALWALVAAHWDNVAFLLKKARKESKEARERLEEAGTLGKQARDILREDK